MVRIKLPKPDPEKEKLKDLCWHAYKTGRHVFAKQGHCDPVLMCEVEKLPDGKAKRNVVVCNIPMDNKELAVKFLTDKFRMLKPIRYAFVFEGYQRKANAKKKDRKETFVCQGSDKTGNLYLISADIVPVEENPKVKKLDNEFQGFTEHNEDGNSLWDGLFDA